MRFSFFFAAACGLLSGCDDQEHPSATNGVNDVRLACEQRASWGRLNSSECLACQTSTILQPCQCEIVREFTGACVTQADATRAEPNCATGVEQCARACAPGDCDCVDRCYAQAATCRTLAGARDGCVAEVCAPYCR